VNKLILVLGLVFGLGFTAQAKELGSTISPSNCN
jgi:hypothetical protein